MTSTTFMFLIVDATEGGEVGIYLVNGRDAPSHMKRRLDRTGRRTFNDLLEDGAEGLDGLVDEESERADERAEEVWEWLRSCTRTENIFNPTDARVLITHTISIAAA